MGGRIVTLQRQARELGRLRTGYTDTSGSKARPVRSQTWIVTSHAEHYVEAAAAELGGTVEKWQPLGNGAAQYRVFTETDSLDAILPPGDPLSQSYELWNKGGCARRCDGTSEDMSSGPCVCIAQFGDEFWTRAPKDEVCKATTRLNVIWPAMPDLGVWRYETHSYYGANEIAGMVDTIRGLVGPHALVPVRLRIEQRTRVAQGQTKHFPVVAVELRGPTAGQLLAGTANLHQIGNGHTGQRPAIEARPAQPQPAQQPPQADTPDWRALIAKADSREVLLFIRQKAVEAGAPNGAEIDAWLKARAAELKEQHDPPPAVAAHPAQVPPPEEDPGEVWQQVIAAAAGHTLSDIDVAFAAANGGLVPGDASAAELRGFLEQLKAGKVAWPNAEPVGEKVPF